MAHLRILHLLILAITALHVIAQRPVPIAPGNVTNQIHELIEYNGELVIAGKFYQLFGVDRNHIAAWDGQIVNEMLGAFESNIDRVEDITEFNGGLAVGGRESSMKNVAFWNGNDWQPFGDGLDGTVKAVEIYNGELYAGGNFETSGQDSIHFIAKWNGSNWEQVGEGFGPYGVSDLEVHNGFLFAGGGFTSDNSGSTELNFIAKWDGTIWQPVVNGLSSGVKSLFSHGGVLYGTGNFQTDYSGSIDLYNGFVFDGSFEPVVFTGDTIKAPYRFYSNNSGDLYFSDASGTRSYDNVEYNHIPMIRTEATANFNGELIFAGFTNYMSYEFTSAVFKIIPGSDKGILTVNDLGFHTRPLDVFVDRAIPANDPVLRYQNDIEKDLMYWTGTWMLGYKDSTMYTDRETFNDTVMSGPTANNYDQQYFERYYQVWHVTADMIDEHISQWNDPGYSMPYSIESWPANGDISNGEAAQLAPYQDDNSNGVYEPENGEYPLIRGDEALYYIYRNANRDWQFSNSSSLEAEIHAMIYGFNMPWSGSQHNSLFVNLKIINRSSLDLDSVKVGIHGDPRIGVNNDDMIGCDPNSSLFYAYNVDDYDGYNDNTVFEDHPPAFGTKFLNQPMASHNEWNDVTSWMSLEDEFLCQMCGLEYFTFEPINDTCIGAPYYAYPGDPVTDTCGFQPYDGGANWSIGSTPWLPFNSGDTICLDYAYIFAQDTLGDNLTSITLLRQYAQEVQDWYDQQNPDCSGSYGWVTAVEENGELSTIKLYPNPTSGMLTIEGQLNGKAELEIYSMTGRLVDTHQLVGHSPKSTVDLSALNNGIYLVVLCTEDQVFTERLIKLNY